MRHFPASRPAHLAGLRESLSQSPEPRTLPTRAWLLVVAATFAAGVALGVVGYAWANLHGILP